MTSLRFVVVYFLIIVSEIFAQTPSSSPPPTCANSNFQMTPTLRQKILDAMNEARQKVKNGQMQLSNGQYALPAEEMPDLTWSCEKEEEFHQYLQSACDSFPYGTSTPLPSVSWSYFGIDVTDNDAFIETGLSSTASFGMSTSLNFARSTYITSPYTLDIYHADAEKVGCAIFTCEIGNKPGNAYPGNFKTNIMCSVDPKVQFGQKLYEVSAAYTNYIPPTQDVICPDTQFSIELREMIKEKINDIRHQISAGTYQLQNGSPALPSLNYLNDLTWSCAEEAAITAGYYNTFACDATLYDPATEFQKIITPTVTWVYPNDVKTYVYQLISEYFVSNPNFNFLSQTTTYSTQYPAAFALSDQAISFACNVKYCYQNTGNFLPDWHFICRVKPATPINGLLYQV